MVTVILVDPCNFDEAGIATAIYRRAGLSWPRRHDFNLLCQMVEEAHPIDVAYRPGLTLIEDPPHAAGGEGELVGQGEDADRRINHDFAADGEAKLHLIDPRAMRPAGGLDRALHGRGIHP